MLLRDRIAPGLAPTSQGGHLTRLLSKFRGNGPTGIYRWDRGGRNATWLCMDTGNDRYACYELYDYLHAGSGKNAHAICGQSLRIPMRPVSVNAAAIAKAGTWVGPYAEATCLGGYFAYSQVADSTATWTTPAGATMVGATYFGVTNGGLWKVSIDGDATRATRLPTAQDIVDAGLAANTILVANGGYLNPTDRVLDTYLNGSDYNKEALFADDLPAGAHVIVLTATGLKRTASAGARGYLTALLSFVPGDTIATSGIYMVTDVVVLPVGTTSDREFALTILPTGGTTPTLVGSPAHGYEQEATFVINVDGSPVTPSDREVVAGMFSVTRTSVFTHPDTAATEHANVSVTYTPTSFGLRVQWSITWLTDTVHSASYVAMMPTFSKWPLGNPVLGAPALDTGANIATSGALALSADDNTHVLDAKSDAMYLWDADGHAAAMLYVPNAAQQVHDWTNSPAAGARFLVEDKSGADGMNKVYMQRSAVGTEETALAGSVWTSDFYLQTIWRDSPFAAVW